MSNTVAWKLGCDNSYTYDENWIISLMGTYTCIFSGQPLIILTNIYYFYRDGWCYPKRNRYHWKLIVYISKFASLFDFLTLYLLSRKQNSWTKGWHGNVHVFSQLQWQLKFYLFQIAMTRNWQWTKLQENKKRFNNKFCIRVLNTRVCNCF